MNYLNNIFTSKIDSNSIKTIVECGSRDCLDAIELNEYYKPNMIYSFECNPESVVVCEKNIIGIPNIKLIDKAVYKEDTSVDFYATDMENSIDKNIGASSLLYHRDNKIEFFQKKIFVDAIRLDTFMKMENIKNIDLLCFDLQGAEYMAIEGLGERIRDVHYLITEISFQSYYFEDRLASKIVEVLKGFGFKMIACDRFSGFKYNTGFGNALFVRK
jgi:FkbM family methyltransferase